MAKAFGILLIVLGVWLGLEIFTNGMDGAFGGIFAQGGVFPRVGGATVQAPADPPVQRIRARVQESMKAAAERSTRGIDDGTGEEDIGEMDRDEVDLDAVDQ